jgi:hypothetical protein
MIARMYSFGIRGGSEQSCYTLMSLLLRFLGEEQVLAIGLGLSGESEFEIFLGHAHF